MPPQAPQQQQQPQQNLATPIAIVIAGGLVALGIYFSGHGAPVVPQTGPNGEKLITTKAQMSALIQKNRLQPTYDPAAAEGTERSIGKKDAPLTMTYWFDYQCPFCKRFEETVLPTLIQKYVNTGKMRFVFKNFAFLGNDSVTASEYAEAVWELSPARFFEWHGAMFDVQDAEGDTGFGNAQTIDTLDSLIAGIDANLVKNTVMTKKAAYDAQMTEERQAGVDLGVNGTPAFQVGKQMISGAQQLAVFTDAIDKALAGK